MKKQDAIYFRTRTIKRVHGLLGEEAFAVLAARLVELEQENHELRCSLKQASRDLSLCQIRSEAANNMLRAGLGSHNAN